MPEFTASDPGSSFPPLNILFNSASGITGQQIQQNQLGLQSQQMQLTAADHEQVGRLAAGLLNEPDLGKRAELYSRGVGMLQAQNLAKYAPPTLPDESTLRSLVSQSVPVADQYKMGLITAPGTKEMLDRVFGGGAAPGTGAGTGSTTATGTAAAPSTIEPTALTSATAVRDGLIKRGMDPVTATAFAANKLHESGATLDSGPGDGGVSQGNFMWNGDRNTEYQQLYGHTPQGAPLDEQLDFVMHELNGKESAARDAINAAQGVDGKAAAISRYYLRPKDVVGETQRRSATALQLQRQLGASGGATAPGVAMGDATRPDLAPPPPGGTAGIPSPYQATGGGIGSVLGGTARVARPTSPAGAPIVTDQPAGGAVVAGPAGTAVVGQPTPASAAVPGDVNAINAGRANRGGTPAQAVEPGWGTVVGTYGPQNQLTPPPAPVPPPQTAVQTPPAATPAAAQPPPSGGTGVNSPQFLQAQEKLRQAYAIKAMPGYATSPQLQAAAGLLTEQAGALAKADTFREDTQGGIHGQRSVLTNQFIPDPARRIAAQPNGDVINDQGKVIYHVDPVELEKDAEGQYWYIPKYPTRGPDGTPVPPRPVGGNLPTPAFAEEQKVEAKRLSDLRTAVLDRAKESAQANTMIANTETALQEAQKGNLGSGALSPQKLQIVATAKALGINLAPFGIDSDKLAAAQVTREQLQQLNGAILRKMYPQRITNADLAISGTVLPNYGLDEQALTSNFDIYKKQNAYDTRMAQDMLAYQDQHHTLVGWENQWHAKNGFGSGPIDNLFGDAQAGRLTSGGTKAGGGNQPPQQAPTVTLPPKALSSLVEGHVTVFSNGQQWTLRNGQPVQVK